MYKKGDKLDCSYNRPTSITYKVPCVGRSIITWYPKETGTICGHDYGWYQSNTMVGSQFTSTIPITIDMNTNSPLQLML